MLGSLDSEASAHSAYDVPKLIDRAARSLGLLVPKSRLRVKLLELLPERKQLKRIASLLYVNGRGFALRFNAEAKLPCERKQVAGCDHLGAHLRHGCV